MDALKAENLLGIMVPAALGGEEASVADVVDVCYAWAAPVPPPA